jgi:hypothetical protein
MLILEWDQKKPNLSLNWIGPNRITTAVNSIVEVEQKTAVIIGPRGAKGDKGDPGTVGGLPAVMDGGNF